MIQKQDILISYYRERKSQREIARDTGMDWKTVRKYIQQYEQRKSELIANVDSSKTNELIDAIVETPKMIPGPTRLWC